MRLMLFVLAIVMIALPVHSQTICSPVGQGLYCLGATKDQIVQVPMDAQRGAILGQTGEIRPYLIQPAPTAGLRPLETLKPLPTLTPPPAPPSIGLPPLGGLIVIGE